MVGGEGDGDGLVVVVAGGVFDPGVTGGGFDDAEVDEFVDEVGVVGDVEAMRRVRPYYVLRCYVIRSTVQRWGFGERTILRC